MGVGLGVVPLRLLGVCRLAGVPRDITLAKEPIQTAWQPGFVPKRACSAPPTVPQQYSRWKPVLRMPKRARAPTKAIGRIAAITQGQQPAPSSAAMSRRGTRRHQQASSDSGSDSDGAQRAVAEALYLSLQLAAGLRRPADFAVAALELAAIVRHLYAERCSKPVQALILQDVALAIDTCDA